MENKEKNNRNNLETKLEHDSEAYRLNKLLDLLLQADTRRLDEICSKKNN